MSLWSALKEVGSTGPNSGPPQSSGRLTPSQSCSPQNLAPHDLRCPHPVPSYHSWRNQRFRATQALVITSPILATALGAGSLRPSPGRSYDLDTCPCFKAAGWQQGFTPTQSRSCWKAGWPHPQRAYKASLGKALGLADPEVQTPTPTSSQT